MNLKELNNQAQLLNHYKDRLKWESKSFKNHYLNRNTFLWIALHYQTNHPPRYEESLILLNNLL